MKRVIFVGIHNKPGLPPLCSSTRTGKVIDQIAMNVSPECQRANLFPVNYLPHDLEERERFIDQFEIDENAVYVGLGKIVCDALHRMDVPLLAVHHPGHILRIGKVQEYVTHVVDRIHEMQSPRHFFCEEDWNGKNICKVQCLNCKRI